MIALCVIIAFFAIPIMIDICGIRKALEKIANKIERR